MKVTKKQLRKIIKESIGQNIQFEWSPSGQTMNMVVDGRQVMQFYRQKEVLELITQLEDLLAGPMRTSP
tara:strand:- start:379 stop:585 length:207 start_codon:yes stop_codon:yes gene_type:complete